MAVQSYSEEPYPEGYLEALENCNALAVNLLQKAISQETITRCWDCSSWVGRCTKGKANTIARDDACDQFSHKPERDTP